MNNTSINVLQVALCCNYYIASICASVSGLSPLSSFKMAARFYLL